MAFSYEPMIDGDLFDVAARFAESADARLAAQPDEYARCGEIDRLWNEADALGWPLSLVPEEAGGAGATLADTFSLIEGAARFAFPGPMTNSLILAPRLLGAEVMAQVAAGAIRPCIVLDAALPWRTTWPDNASLRLEESRIDGRVLGTEMVSGATHYALAVDERLALVSADDVETRIHRRIDGRLAVDLVLASAPADLVAPQGAIADAIDLAALAACVEIVAGAATVIEDTVRYLNERHQFGVALSSFQVLRHYVADMYVAYQNAHAVTSAVLRTTFADPENLPSRSIAQAKLRVGEVGRFVAETSIQAHGGMGMTEENRATRIGKRLMMADLEWGDRAWLAEHLLDTQELAA